MENNVEIVNLTKRYPKFTLQSVSLRLPKGAVVGLIGENGAGKSTLIGCMTGTVLPDGGSVRIFGKGVNELSREERARVAVVLGEEFFPQQLTLAQIGKVWAGILPGWNGETYANYLSEFSLPSDQKYKNLSKGMKQKAALAAALSHGADLLLLDEATVGLDPVARDEILDILYEFMQNENRSILLSSHIIGDLEKICDYICFLSRGEIVFFEEKDSLYETYALFQCGEEELRELDPAAVVGVRRTEVGVTALVRRAMMPSGAVLERAEIADIMLYISKGERIK